MVVPPFGAEVGMTGGENDDPMSPTRCDTTPMMEAKRPDKELLKQKLEQLSKAQGPLQLASGERVSHLPTSITCHLGTWQRTV